MISELSLGSHKQQTYLNNAQRHRKTYLLVVLGEICLDKALMLVIEHICKLRECTLSGRDSKWVVISQSLADGCQWQSNV